jgi:hypothetical protein
MAKNKIEDLRNLLFETMEKLLDDENPMDAKQAQAVANVGKVIVESARVEVEFRRQFGGNGTGFIPNVDSADNKLEESKPLEPKQITRAPIVTVEDGASVCVTHAAKFGHSKNAAEECEEFSVGCPYCPLKDLEDKL